MSPVFGECCHTNHGLCMKPTMEALGMVPLAVPGFLAESNWDSGWAGLILFPEAACCLFAGRVIAGSWPGRDSAGQARASCRPRT